MKSNLHDLKIGLVLAGGGAKGAYEYGVYKALRELELINNIKVISGTSIGAVNALLFAMDNPKIISDSWGNLNYSRFLLNRENDDEVGFSNVVEKVKKFSSENNIFEQISLSDIGLISQTGIKGFIDEYFDMDIFRRSDKAVYVCAYNIDKERPEYFRIDSSNEQEIKDRVLASCSVPHLFKPVIIDGIKYADGGIQSPLYTKKNVDNVPILPMKDHDLDMIIVVHLSYKDNLQRDGFEDKKIVEIFPSSPLEIVNGAGTLNLSKNSIDNNIELGYRDTIVIFAPMVINILQNISIEKLIEKNDEQNKKYFNK